ncbi:HNH endonuclease [Streptosporangium jomthongense]|uniref:HNH endonuclease n=1 Tax=Streptosporangium jomthongense TaxID=1193683 RepID=A0ABV8F190_9ACTN
MGSGRPRKLPVSNGGSQAWKELRLEILIRDGYTCQHCGIGVQEGDGSAHLDHIIPRVEGGSTTPDNLRILCRTCNTTKGAMEGAKNALAKRALKTSEAEGAEKVFVPTEGNPEPGVWTF